MAPLCHPPLGNVFRVGQPKKSFDIFEKKGVCCVARALLKNSSEREPSRRSKEVPFWRSESNAKQGAATALAHS